MRIPIAAAAALTALALPAVASAHHITGGTATCTEATATYSSFSESNKPISYKVYVDSALLLSGSGTFPGSSGSITATYPAPLAAGDHVVKWVSTWPGQGDQNGSFTKEVTGCEGPPVPVQPVTPAPVVEQSAPALAPPVQSAPALPPAKKKVTPKPKKRCEFGRRRYDSKGKRLRDSKGRRITLCIVKHKAPVYRTPTHLTG